MIPVIFKVSGALPLCCVRITDSLQFGFKRNIVCTEAVFTLKSMISNFVDNGSLVYIALLDINKTFDKVNHCKLFNSLLAVSMVPVVTNALC